MKLWDWLFGREEHMQTEAIAVVNLEKRFRVLDIALETFWQIKPNGGAKNFVLIDGARTPNPPDSFAQHDQRHIEFQFRRETDTPVELKLSTLRALHVNAQKPSVLEPAANRR